ncbi:MAG: hypothetical protein ACI8XD_001981 [Thermoproteota archaeon]|jgi:hypothetical protein
MTVLWEGAADIDLHFEPSIAGVIHQRTLEPSPSIAAL